MLQFFRVLGSPEGFFVRECPGAGCLWAPDSGGTMGLRRGSGSLACHPVLPQPPGSFQDMPSRSSNSHTASRLSFTLGRRGGVGFISRVPSPGIAGRTGRGTHCFRPGCRGKRPQLAAAASPACPCVRAFLLPRKSWAAARNRSIHPDRRRSIPTRWTASCRLWCRWLPRRYVLGGGVADGVELHRHPAPISSVMSSADSV